MNKDLCQKLIGSLSRDIVPEAGERLGFREGDSLVCDPDEELPVLLDYAIFHMRWKGRTAYEHYLVDSPPDPHFDEMRCLEAMQTSTFSIFVIEEIQPGLGVVFRNLLSSETVEVVDVGLGSTAEPGIMLATRILYFDELNMTGGAPLVVNPPEKNPDRWLKRLLKLDAIQGGGFSDPAPVMRRCLFPNEGENKRVV